MTERRMYHISRTIRRTILIYSMQIYLIHSIRPTDLSPRPHYLGEKKASYSPKNTIFRPCKHLSDAKSARISHRGWCVVGRAIVALLPQADQSLFNGKRVTKKPPAPFLGEEWFCCATKCPGVISPIIYHWELLLGDLPWNRPCVHKVFFFVKNKVYWVVYKHTVEHKGIAPLLLTS